MNVAISRIEARQADITKLALDAIVNAANEELIGGWGVDGAIHRAAGSELLAECRKIGRCPTGEARIAPGFRLPAKHVILTVGPKWRGGGEGEPALLASCYRESLALAAENQIRTIAFPAISTGAYNYPVNKAAAVAVAETRAFLDRDDTIERVIFACFDEEMLRTYEAALAPSA